ncbi:MAG: hypothetical protein ACLUJG_06080 [Lawsonibacter sp.]
MARRDCLTLDNGMRLRLLSALEVLQARREAGAGPGAQRARPVLQCLPAGPGSGDGGGQPNIFRRRGGPGGAAGGGDRRPGQDLEPV